jgi:hypothetical protein
MTSKGWLMLSVVALAGVGVVVAVKLGSTDDVRVRGITQGVDLDQVIEVFKESGGSKDLKSFEDALNLKGLYPAAPLTVTWDDAQRPAIVGYVDKNGNRIYEKGVDTFVFKLEIERPSASEYRVIASDGYYYRHHSIIGDLAMMYVAGSLMNALWLRHSAVFGMGPRVVYRYSYAPRGYYRSPSYSRGSWGGRSTGGRVGGK